jgi:pimeloyl-ACP methyl ester carboxylesterase
MKTSILYQKSPIIDIEQYAQRSINTIAFYQVYKDLFQFDFENRYISLNSLKEKKNQSHFDNIIPLAILHSNYETIKKESFENGSITKDSQGFLRRTNSTSDIFELHTLTIASPLRIKKKGLKTTFILSEETIFNTSKNTIKSVKIDFNDTLGFREIILNEKVTIQYQNAGTKEIVTKITFSDGSMTTSSSVLKVMYSNKDNQSLFNRVTTTFNSTLDPDLSVYGEQISYHGLGEYEIFLSPDAVFDKPIIIIDGFDPTDNRPIVGYTDSGTENYKGGIYDLLDFNNNGTSSNLGDLVRAEGFDVVILNFPEYPRVADNSLVDGGSDYIERNAMLLVELIDILNTQKVGVEENVIIGPSMGGLISRYALNYMENKSLDHQTRLWLSFDAPHYGANVPIGLQHQFNFFGNGLDDFLILGDYNNADAQKLVNEMLKSPAARQMLNDHFEAHLVEGSLTDFNLNLTLPQKHSFNPIFYDRLNALTVSGFPEELRKISIINGSGVNDRYQNIYGADIEPGSQIMDTNFNVTTGTDIFLTLNFTPPANTEINVSSIHLDFAWWVVLANDLKLNASSKAYPYSNSIDAASGGLFDIGGLTANLDTSGLLGSYLNALKTDFFNFIPSVSAMALGTSNDEINWFHEPLNIVSTRDTNNTTPFDAWYMPLTNEPHVTVTQDNFNFAWNEIVLSVLNTQEFDLNNSYTILKNPVSEIIQIQVNKQDVKNITVKVYSLTGKEVVSKIIDRPSKQLQIPVNLSAGVYLLELNDSETIFKAKIIID